MKNITLQIISLLALILWTACNSPQENSSSSYWQQHISYNIDANLDVNTNLVTATQHIVYTNNSPDTLTKVYFHLFWNAFQKESMMYEHSGDPSYRDSKVRDRIDLRSPEELGYIHVKDILQDGKKVEGIEDETVLTISLKEAILPGGQTTISFDWEAQVPLMTRRAGRDNLEGIRYSMTQWYPKLAEYDADGWHPYPYVAREFYGVWGDFDVTLTLDKSYVVGGTGYIQNPNEVGHGYETSESEIKEPENDLLSWHFLAENVHDFAWAADPDYDHRTFQVPDGPTIHLLLQPTDSVVSRHDSLGNYAVKLFQELGEQLGPYPYKQYSIIQGGDGGTEYPMATLITASKKARKNLEEICRVTTHEVIHAWFQGMLGTNENLYAWMDEGFTRYQTRTIMSKFFPESGDHFASSYIGYRRMVKAGLQEPMSKNSDHFLTAYGHGQTVYAKSGIGIRQLSYIMGQETLENGMRKYVKDWSFKHPKPENFMRIMEDVSDINLDWYFNYWVNTTDTIDYGIVNVEQAESQTVIQLKRIGQMPMPIDLVVHYSNETKKTFHIPLGIMLGAKKSDSYLGEFEVVTPWKWTHRDYEFALPESINTITKIEIDPSGRMADLNKEDNTYEIK